MTPTSLAFETALRDPRAGIAAMDLWDLILSPDCPDLIDVCLPEDAADLGCRVPHSRRAPHREARADRPAVVICQRGLKLSQGTAAALRDGGIPATHLTGGIVAWQRAGLPTLGEASLGAARLVTFSAAPFASAALHSWIVARLLPPDTRAMCVDVAMVPDVAERFGAAIYADPSETLHSLGIDADTLLAVVTEVATEKGPLARILRGICRRHGTGQEAMRAAALIFDHLAQGDPA